MGDEKERKFDSFPTKLQFGAAATCPRCKGRGTSKDPITKVSGPCRRCNGYGLIPVH